MTNPQSRIFRAACVQLRSGREVASNVAAAVALIREAAARGAQYVQTPENTHLIEHDAEALFAKARPEAEDEGLQAFRAAARECRIWLHVGSLAVRVAADRVANRSYLVAPDGGLAACYDKIHMFDVDLAGGESYRESARVQAGERAVLCDLPWGRIGLTICYDLRFAQLYRHLAQAGAEFLAVPAAFTRRTGEAHWHVLLRARAIETGCFVLAAAQGGRHENGRETYGHSLMVAPWGEILAEAEREPGVILADIDPAQVAQARRQIPALAHDRPFAVAAAGDATLRAAS